MCEVAAEEDFYRIKGLFNQAIDVPKIVQTFQEIYDPDFQFEGTRHQLYLAIQQWLTKNNSWKSEEFTLRLSVQKRTH